MTRFITAAIFIVASLFTFNAVAQDDAISTGYFSDVALDGYDTVAYFILNKPVAGSEKYMATWRDATWHFSNAENLALFTKSPEKYAPQYGAYCAWAMSGGKTVGADPEVWHIEEGKLYLNYNKNVQNEWLANIKNDINSADQFYPEVTNVNKY